MLYNMNYIQKFKIDLLICLFSSFVEMFLEQACLV